MVQVTRIDKTLLNLAKSIMLAKSPDKSINNSNVVNKALKNYVEAEDGTE